MSRTISRLYNSHAEARAAVRELEAAGVPHGDISILVSNADSAYDEKTKSFPDRDLDGKDDRAEGAATGGGVGAAIGGTAGLLAGLGLMAIPGVGPVVAAGLRRGGALVSVKLDDAEASRIQPILDRSSVRVADRAAAYRKAGWTKYDPMAQPYTRDEVIRERS